MPGCQTEEWKGTIEMSRIEYVDSLSIHQPLWFRNVFQVAFRCDCRPGSLTGSNTCTTAVCCTATSSCLAPASSGIRDPRWSPEMSRGWPTSEATQLFNGTWSWGLRIDQESIWKTSEPKVQWVQWLCSRRLNRPVKKCVFSRLKKNPAGRKTSFTARIWGRLCASVHRRFWFGQKPFGFTSCLYRKLRFQGSETSD